MTNRTAARLIRLVSIMFFPASLIFASGAFSALDGLSVAMHDILDWPFDQSIEEYTREARWFSAIGGGVFASLCALMFFVIAPLIQKGEHAIRGGVIASLLVWFLIDSAGSIAAGVPANAVFNVLFLALFIGPLVALKPVASARR